MNFFAMVDNQLFFVSVIHFNFIFDPLHSKTLKNTKDMIGVDGKKVFVIYT